MEKVYKKEALTGYKIGDKVEIHSNINDPESWFLTIRGLEIYAESLCKKSETEQDIAHKILMKLQKKLNNIQVLIEDIIPFI